jgi:ubiquinone/menaquinone biosynthesis C-methylase UbiE
MYEQELQRIRVEYQRREASASLSARYQIEQPATRLNLETLRQALYLTLVMHDITDLSDKHILDIGCGSGGWLSRFNDFGALPENLFGIDLLPNRIEQARSAHPDFHFSIGSAHQLPYSDASFDLVISFVLFSSILDDALQAAIAQEMLRVLQSDGLILIYDFTYDNPRNHAVHGLSKKDMHQLFPGAFLTFQRITLAPPLARFIAPRAYWLAQSLERCKVLNTHLLTTIRKGRRTA